VNTSAEGIIQELDYLRYFWRLAPVTQGQVEAVNTSFRSLTKRAVPAKYEEKYREDLT
jgi:hypothetical protein